MLIQGALNLETSRLIQWLKNARSEKVDVWTFWQETIDGYPVIVSKTWMGSSHAAAATDIDRYNSIAIINQGTSGGHDPSLHNFDIVIGTSTVNLGAYKTLYRSAGMGSSTLDWILLDLKESDENFDDDLHDTQYPVSTSIPYCWLLHDE